MDLCLDDLARLTGGELRLAAMPPRDGGLARVRRIVLSAEAVSAGDLFWCLARQGCNIELAFLRGALGVIAAGQPIEPWPGRFSLLVDDPVAGMKRLIEGLAAGRQFFDNSSELKVLQLCAAGGADIYPPACGQSAKGHSARRCRRQAA
jgi:hypothetical protein